MTILNEIAEYTKKRYIEQEKVVPFEEIKSKAERMDSNTGLPFEKALAKEGLSYICEVKKASPSKGIIAEDFPYKEIAKDYEKAGASAISCLTEPKYFKGKNQYLEEISKEVSIPILRKDFTVCSYQIYEAKVIGASAILLICAILTEEEIKEYLDIATSLGLSALVEAHTEEEVKMALNCGAKIIGVNNRNLKDFTVNPLNSLRLREQIPADKFFVAESGIAQASDCAGLKAAGVQAVLVGEALMRSANPAAMLKEMRA